MPNLVIQPDATIFLTGVNGLIGSHIADQLLKRGYNVRGAVRDVEISKWLLEYFEGTSGFIHIASPLSGDDPNVVIPNAVNAGLNALKASAKTPSIKRVVYTSSAIASTFPSLGVEKVLDQNSYNEVGLAKGWKHPEDEPAMMKVLHLYAAIKTATEKACWDWVKQNRPDFSFNSILPNVNLGKVLVPEKQGTPSIIQFAKFAFDGGELFSMVSKSLVPQYFISTEDCAHLHISALIHSDVTSERVFGFAYPWDFNQLLAIYRNLYPDRTFPKDLPDSVADGAKMPRERAEEILGWVKEGAG